MLFNKPVSNPYLAGAVELVKSDDSPENKKTLAEQIMKAEYLCPVFVAPHPVKDENGIPRLAENAKVQFPTLRCPDGRLLFPVFSDAEELHKWKSEEDCPYTYACNFDDMTQLLSHLPKQEGAEVATGFVINPMGCNYVVERDMVANLLLKRELSYMESQKK